ncbi:MAG: hypothetical protein ACRENS_09740 [Candidatus Eiseniibacteriota bacterium]
MNAGLRRSRPFWHASDSRVLRPELWLVAAVVVTMMLVEVWQSSKVADLCLKLDQSRSKLEQTEARLAFVKAGLEHRTTRSGLAASAAAMGLVPADNTQVLNLPSEYLAASQEGGAGGGVAMRSSFGEGIARMIVPDARARDRAGN